MDQLTNNRYFKHSETNAVVESRIEKDEDGKYCLYLHLVEGDNIVGGVNGESPYMLASFMIVDDWQEILEGFMAENSYEEYNPFKMTHEDATNFIKKCRGVVTKSNNNLRLGQIMINKLGTKTPTPNIKIFNSLDENEVLSWFYQNYT